MNKYAKGLKMRYIEGITWMKDGEGMPSMMYLATIIMEIFILCKVNPENAIQYIKALGVNLVLLYFYSIGVSHFAKNSAFISIQRLGFVAIELFVWCTIAKGLTFWIWFVLFVAPIIVAFVMIYANFTDGLEDFINLKNISNFGVVVLTTLIPVLTITAPLIFLEWNIFIKIGIIAGFMLIAPLICWADLKEYGIFGAMGIEW